jgi:two-component system chemotaxis response regulator CheY
MAKILIVDDSSATRIQLRNFLEPSHHECFDAGNGLEALDQLKTNKVDLIICDLNMPEMDGIEFITRQSQDSNINDIPTIMCTTETINKKSEAGMVLYEKVKKTGVVKAWIVKPVTPKKASLILGFLDKIIKEKM